MSDSKKSTLSAQTQGGTSLLQRHIPTPEMQAAAQAILPYINNLPAGKYTSEIVDVAEAVQKGDVVGIDCTHKLTNADGNIWLVKFRFFDPIDTENLIQVLASYGLSGNIGSALMGLRETVDIAPRPNSVRYMYIAERKQFSESESSFSSSVSSTSTLSPKRGGLSSRLSRRSNKPTQTARQTLISDIDDEDDSDDWEEYGDED